MGQTDICMILKKMYPNWLTVDDVSKISNLRKSTIVANLARLRKRNDIEFKMEPSIRKKGGFVTYYRIIMEE